MTVLYNQGITDKHNIQVQSKHTNKESKFNSLNRMLRPRNMQQKQIVIPLPFYMDAWIHAEGEWSTKSSEYYYILYVAAK